MDRATFAHSLAEMRGIFIGEIMTNDDFNKLLGITESYKMPGRLMEILTGDNVAQFYDAFLELNSDLSHDVLRDYFQEEHGDRGKLKQDYTPDSLCELVKHLAGEKGDTLDVCAGTGALTISCDNGEAHRCEEVSERALPVLLLNMGIRGMKGTAALKDVLTGKAVREYEMMPEGRYTRPRLVTGGASSPKRWKRIVSNPPYSLKFPEVDKAAEDPRFKYGLTPSNFSDYLFVQDALSRLTEDGTLIEILPHGVLFRGKREEAIRKRLIEENLIDTVIGLPDNLFMNTGIPVLIMILKRNRCRSDSLMVDASKGFEKSGNVNVMTPEHITRIVCAVKLRADVDRFSHVATIEEIRENRYNLNIPRYVDTFEPEPVPDLIDTLTEIAVINRQIRETEKELIEMASQLTGTTELSKKLVERSNKMYEEYLNEHIKNCTAPGSR